MIERDYVRKEFEMHTSFRPLILTIGAVGALLAAAIPAGAVVNQPNGAIIPATNVKGALEAFVNGSTNNQGINEGIDSQRDAQTTPEQFSPLCDFSGRYIAKGGSANFAIGWYNVNESRMTAPIYRPVDLTTGLNTPANDSEIYILFPFAGALPPANMQDLSAASIRQHPKYLGGLIGFVLIPNPVRATDEAAAAPHTIGECS
jgi:hypothetical protein